jgi:hypothetical protein
MFRYIVLWVFLFALGCGGAVSASDPHLDASSATDAGSAPLSPDSNTSFDIMADSNTFDVSPGEDGLIIEDVDEQQAFDTFSEDTESLPDSFTGEDVFQDVTHEQDIEDKPQDTLEPEPDAPLCMPICGEKECGEDGCGGTCGVCEGIDTCIDGFCMVTCDFENQIYLEGEGFVASDGCSICLCLSTGTVGCNSEGCIETCAANCPLEKIGDGNCDLSCWNESCAFDTSPEGVPDCSCIELSMEEDCLGICSSMPLSSQVGNGICDDGSAGSHLNCATFDFDGGDCDTTSVCPGGGVADCVGDCWPSDLIGLVLGDGVCHEFLECVEWNFDEGDCYQGPGCQEGYLPDCNEECWPWDLLGLLEGDGACHDFLECEAWDFDGGDCYQGPGCQPGTVEDCFGECYPSDFVGLFFGDQICHDFLNCPLWDYDGGDCL